MELLFGVNCPEVSRENTEEQAKIKANKYKSDSPASLPKANFQEYVVFSAESRR